MNTSSPQPIYSVSEFNQSIKLILEKKFPLIWIYGEISNLKIAASGHLYCTLKDEKSQIAIVIFRGQLRQLKFTLQEGMGILALGRLSVYEPRGMYQLILEYAEPKGVGALQLAFEQLKQRLGKEGLFDTSRKVPLPFLPSSVSIITSTSGAVLHDILHIIDRRFPSIAIDVWPVKVQGDGAAEGIAHAIVKANEIARTDIIILARGGGSIEDLAAFNSEKVARAIFSSVIPIISAVGHETDYTIADFVADMRAPTPSAAAELVVPLKAELRLRCGELQNRCISCIQGLVSAKWNAYRVVRRALVHPSKAIQELALRLDDNMIRLNRAVNLLIQIRKDVSTHLARYIMLNIPKEKISKYKLIISGYNDILLKQINTCASERKLRLSSALASLDALSPLAVLKRGYSIVRSLPEKRIITREKDVQHGDSLEVTLAEGQLKVTVDKS